MPLHINLNEVIVHVKYVSEYLLNVNYMDIVRTGPGLYKDWWIQLASEAPQHVFIETCLLLFILWLTFVRQTVDPKMAYKNERITDAEREENIAEWSPDPIVPDLVGRDEMIVDKLATIVKVDGNYVTLDSSSQRLLNLGSYDFLGMGQLPAVKEASRAALDHYGCGSCGPRGFYGTIDKHLEIERDIAAFMGVEEAISYSDSASTVNSSIPAFAKKGDLLIVDEAVNESIRTGLTLSRAKVEFFKHNDMAHLKAILRAIARDDKRYKRDSTQQRRFIVIEGLYRSIGDVCCLPEIMELKDEYCYRLIIDESLSFGTLGTTGKGVTELYGVNIRDIEIIMISMDTALASVGGLCIGSRTIVDHQRLSGAGYVFSAAAPPFLSAAAMVSLEEMKKKPALLETLRSRVQLFHRLLKEKGVTSLVTSSSEESPVIHLRLAKESSWEDEETVLMTLETEMQNRGVLAWVTRYHSAMLRTFKSNRSVRPSLRIHLHSMLSTKEVETAVSAIRDAARRKKIQ